MRVGIRCDAGPRTGVGHLVRCVALAEELIGRGATVTFLTDPGGVACAEAQLAGRGLHRQPAPATPAELVSAAAAHQLDVVVLDSYELDPRSGSALRDAGFLVAAIMDGTAHGQLADIYIDQNLHAEDARLALPAGAVRLAGVRYAMLRDSIRSLRPARPDRTRTGTGRRPHVVCFFGGTDAYGAAPVLTRLLAGTATAYRATVVAGSPGLRGQLAAIRPGDGQSIEVIGPTDTLPALCSDADLVISASGTSTWELLCLGAPAALVQVVDNQRIGYERVVARGLAAGLGQLDRLRDGSGATAVATLRRLLTNPDERATLGARGWAVVDGRGRERVVDQIEVALNGRLRTLIRIRDKSWVLETGHQGVADG